MGSWLSRPTNEVEEVQSQPNAFRYPPKSGKGNYFGSHFIMGGERFETPQPEQYLFGENSDLNFLGSKPTPFPYPAPQSSEPTKTLKALINIRKESLRLVKLPQYAGDKDDEKIYRYNIEFTFDADVRSEIKIMFFCKEEVTSHGIIYKPRDEKISSETIKFKAGANQLYNNSALVIAPSEWDETDLVMDFEREMYPVVIFCRSLEGDDPRQSHTTSATFDRHSDGTYVLKPLKQKLFVDGLAYLLQEIYGIENKHSSRKEDDSDNDDNETSECVICMSDVRDTLILPCKHLCLCHACADSLRYQANNCPICRAPFRALLQIRAVYRIPPAPIDYPALPPDMPVIQMNAIPGYEIVPLLEALNGPYQPSELSAAAAALTRQEAARALNPSEETMEHLPIAMTFMVSPREPEGNEIRTTGIGKIPESSSKKSLCSSVMVVSEVDGKKPRGMSAMNSISISSLEGKSVMSMSDPEEDDKHFSEAPHRLPDLKEFSNLSLTSPTKYSGTESEEDGINDIENDEPLDFTSKGKMKNMMMIAAIDEFSDEDDCEAEKVLSASIRLGGPIRVPTDSTQSTPVKTAEDHKEYNRYGRSLGTSLPTTPNTRLSSAGIATGTSTSTRSSGDSFTSSSSTKQLLPPSANNHHQI